MSDVTRNNAAVLSYAYDYFNRVLFGGVLPDALIILHRKNGARGYHQTDTYRARVEGIEQPYVSEIALNPDDFAGRSTKLIMSTLVHEMVHEWQCRFGLDYKPGTHNTEWADKMEQIGLIPTSTGAPGGKRTGKRATHIVEVGGPFDVACTELLHYIDFQYEAQPVMPKPKKETVKRIKVACIEHPDVEARVIPGVTVCCGLCGEPLEELF